AVAQPESTSPTCSTLQRDAPTLGPTCTDHFHPGWYVARPMVMPPMRTSSNFPFSNVRTSSGSSKRFRTVSSIAITPSSELNPSSLHGIVRQYQTCRESMTTRQIPLGACVRAFHWVRENARPTRANTRRDLALLKLSCLRREEPS